MIIIKSLSKSLKTYSFTSWEFPGGEVGVRINDFIGEQNVLLSVKLKNSTDVFTLLMLTDALRRMGVQNIYLELPYIPYARQDRVMTTGESLSIKVFADLINSQNYKEIHVLDAHSPVSLALINNVYEKNNHNFVYGVFRDYIHRTDDILLVTPDAGGAKKIEGVAKALNYSNDIIIGAKQRDLKTGAIINTYIDRPELVESKHCVIIDDICDGGKTFIELGKVLKQFKAKQVSLIVTHGIFSKGLKVFEGIIDNIYTTDSFYTEGSIPQTEELVKGLNFVVKKIM